MVAKLILLAFLFASQAVDPTLPPANAHLVFTAEGRGVQIYRCTLQDASYTWVFQSPEATLFGTKIHEKLGTHSAGPTWTWSDGSAISGKVLQKSPSSASDAIPWLLLSTAPSGSTDGALTPITLVRRSDTHGGNAPPSGCDAQHANTMLKVPYTATYSFFTAQ